MKEFFDLNLHSGHEDSVDWNAETMTEKIDFLDQNLPWEEEWYDEEINGLDTVASNQPLLFRVQTWDSECS